jgi:hypothetical protein
MKNNRRLAVSAALHCLVGCAIGELIGVAIGTYANMPPYHIVLLAFILSFISGYTTSTLPLVRAKMPLSRALKIVLAADTVSILTMTLVDNLLMLSLPGAFDKNLTHTLYWVSRIISFTVAFIAAYPVNLYLLNRGKGHALMHEYHTSDHHH